MYQKISAAHKNVFEKLATRQSLLPPGGSAGEDDPVEEEHEKQMFVVCTWDFEMGAPTQSGIFLLL